MAKRRKAKDERPGAIAEQAGEAQQRDANGDPAPPRSEIAAELLAFAGRLKSNAKEALTFCGDEVEKRIGWGATKNAETRFFNRARETSQELRERGEEFDGLDAKCASADPGRPLVDDLAGGGLPEAIQIVSADLAGIAVRSERPLTDEDRNKITDELQGCRKLLETILETAAWIMDEAITIRGGTVPGRERPQPTPSQSALSPEIELALQKAETVVKEVIDELEKELPDLEHRSKESELAHLKRLGPGFSQIERTSKKVVAIQKIFTDKHREIAEKQGHAQFLQFLETNDHMLKRVTARRRISTELVKGVIERYIARLSLTDEGADKASEIVVSLEDVLKRLQSDQRLLERRSEQATNELLANAVTAEQLPAWSALGEQGKVDEHGVSELQMFLMAFVQRRGKKPAFGEATKKQLRERLNEMLVDKNRRQLSVRQFEKLLVEAKRLNIVYKQVRPPNTSPRIGDEFELCAAAIKKYRRHLIRP